MRTAWSVLGQTTTRSLAPSGLAEYGSDDEFITEDAYLEQPTDRVSLISGFNYISRIFRSALLCHMSLNRTFSQKPHPG